MAADSSMTNDLVDFIDVDELFGVLKNLLPKSIAGERVEVREHSSFCKGKGLFTTEEIQGAELAMIEEPFVYVNLIEGSANCRANNPFLKAIDAPGFFGDPEYRITDKRKHLPALWQLTLGVLDKLKDNKSSSNAAVREWCRKFASEELEKLNMYKNACKLTLKVCSSEFPALNKKTLTLLFRTIHCNSLLAKSPLLIDTPYGVGMWIKGARINHSCDPNCMEVIARGKLYIVAVRKIALGDEITIDYNRHYGTSIFGSMYRTRQTSTQKKKRDWELFGFECTCKVCVADTALETAASEEKTTVGELTTIAMEKLNLTGEDLKKWNWRASLMHASLYQIAENYNPSTYRTLEPSKANIIRQSIISVLDDSTQILDTTRTAAGGIFSINPLEPIGVHPFFTLIKLVLTELLFRGKGTDFTPTALTNARIIAEYLLKLQGKNKDDDGDTTETLEQIEITMTATALMMLIDNYDNGKPQLEQEAMTAFVEAFVINLSVLFWVPFVFPMLAMKEGQMSFGAMIGMTSYSLSMDQIIRWAESKKK